MSFNNSRGAYHLRNDNVAKLHIPTDGISLRVSSHVIQNMTPRESMRTCGSVMFVIKQKELFDLFTHFVQKLTK